MGFSPKKFSKFILLDKIASGGMAEIFLAQTQGPGGFEKTVALKRILPQYSSSEEFISMFIDEARTTSQLSHSNIVQIYEFGHEESHYYLSMEFVDGKNLRQILQRAEELKRPIPMEHAVYIAGKICEGLDYAHRFRDKRAQTNLHIIHRDISPQNVLVSFEGEVKLIDFGIAKTRAKSGKTRSGVLKGKFGYMSPEQAHGEILDQRTDIFSTGIILFEMLTRQRLFQSNNDLNTLKKIQEAKIPTPSLFNPDIPYELEEIVLKSLEKDRSKRYQTAKDLHQDLSRFLNTLNPDFTTAQASSFVRSLFALDILEHKKKLKEIEIKSLLEEPPPPVEIKSPKPSFHKAKTVTDIKSLTDQKTVASLATEAQKATYTDEGYDHPRKVWMQISLLGLFVLTLSMLLLYLNQNPSRLIQSQILEEAPSEERSPDALTDFNEKPALLRIETEPSDANIFIDGKLMGATPLTLPRLDQRKKYSLVIEKDGFHPLEENIFLTSPSQNIKKNLVQVGLGYLNVSTITESDIEIDGKPVGKSPLIKFPLETGKHTVRAVNKERGLAAEKEVDIAHDKIELLDEDDLVLKPTTE